MLFSSRWFSVKAGLAKYISPLLTSIVVVVSASYVDAQPEAKSETPFAALNPRAQSLLTASMHFSDGYYDARVALLWSPAPEDSAAGESRKHRVRESAWYALGLLVRDQPGDQKIALCIFNAILAEQIDAPGHAWDGTFYRWPEEPPVPPNAGMWTQFDPNWRQFIGCTFALAMETCGSKIPMGLQERMHRAILHAVEGEIHQGRLTASYTNIALMHAWLLAYSGQHAQRPELVVKGEQLAQAIKAGFQEHGTFEEYNSPTYYGVDFYGLALWRAHPPTPLFRQLSADMEAGLWKDVAAFYHAGLKNICGPYDRTYGMDMRHYVALTGLWLSLSLEPNLVPLPNPSGSMAHAHDFVYGICFALLGTEIPAEAKEHFERFRGERFVTRKLPGDRVATAWLADKIMLGGEYTAHNRAAGVPLSQLVPASAHWLTPTGDVGWIGVKNSPRCDAHAEKNSIEIKGVGDFVLRICVKGLDATQLVRGSWKLPGLLVQIETDAVDFAVQPGDGFTDIHYKEATKIILRTAVDRS